MFYIFAVALIAGSLGYALGAGFMMAIGFDMSFITWLVGIIAGVAVAIAVLVLNIQKWVIVIATALLGAAVIVGTFLFMFGNLPPQQLVANPVRFVLQTSPFWMIVFLIIAVLGGVAQYQTSRRLEIDTYNRWEQMA
jgi:Ni,Fe-hydrogenase I cytochrome b subunit